MSWPHTIGTVALLYMVGGGDGMPTVVCLKGGGGEEAPLSMRALYRRRPIPWHARLRYSKQWHRFPFHQGCGRTGRWVRCSGLEQTGTT